MLGFLECLERPSSILTGPVDAGSSVGSEDASGEDSKVDVIPGGSRRRSGSFKAKGFPTTVSPPCGSSIMGIAPGGIPDTITSSSILSSTGLDTVKLNTPRQLAKISLSEDGKSQALSKSLYCIFY